MEMADKVRMLQTIYAAALADSVRMLGKEGVLESVTRQKRAEQMSAGKMRAAQMGITNAEDVFIKLSDLMGCADWTITPDGDGKGFTATASRCMLCAMAKKMGTQSPCHVYCLDPMEGMVKGLCESAQFEVNNTLFDGSKCSVAVLK
jgi:hypothetical protein